MDQIEIKSDIGIRVDEVWRVKKLFSDLVSDWRRSVFYIHEMALITGAGHYNIFDKMDKTCFVFDGDGISADIVTNPYGHCLSDGHSRDISYLFQRTISGALGTGRFSRVIVDSFDKGRAYSCVISVGENGLPLFDFRYDTMKSAMIKVGIQSDTRIRFECPFEASEFSEYNQLEGYINGRNFCNKIPVKFNGRKINSDLFLHFVYDPVVMDDGVLAYLQITNRDWIQSSFDVNRFGKTVGKIESISDLFFLRGIFGNISINEDRINGREEFSRFKRELKKMIVGLVTKMYDELSCNPKPLEELPSLRKIIIDQLNLFEWNSGGDYYSQSEKAADDFFIGVRKIIKPKSPVYHAMRKVPIMYDHRGELVYTHEDLSSERSRVLYCVTKPFDVDCSYQGHKVVLLQSEDIRDDIKRIEPDECYGLPEFIYLQRYDLIKVCNEFYERARADESYRLNEFRGDVR